MKTRMTRPLLLLCLLGLLLESCLHVDALSIGISRQLEKRAVAEKQRKFLKAAGIGLDPSANESGRRLLGLFRGNKENERENPQQQESRVAVRPRPTVRLDHATGQITEMIPVAQPRSQRPTRRKWDSMKRAVYGTVDAVASAASKLPRLRNQNKYDTVSEGYGMLETKVLAAATTSRDSPGRRLMKEYQARVLPDPDVPEDKPAMSKFDGFKEGVYSTAEGVASFLSSSSSSSTTAQEQVATAFKPVTRRTIRISSEVREALPNLKSKNPVTKWKAQQRIERWENGQRALGERSALEAFKERIFQVGDAFQSMVAAIATFPAKISEAAAATGDAARAIALWAASFPQAVEELSTTIAGIPEEFERKVNEVQTSVEAGIQNTQKFMEDVQALPKTIQRTVDDTVYNVKVLVGLEEKRPMPPATPPPKPVSLEEAVWGFTGALGKATVEFALWVGVEVAKLSLKGAGMAAQTALTKASKKMAESKDRSVQVDSSRVVAKQSLEAASMKSKQAVASGKDGLKGEVSDALKLAEKGEVSDALKLAEKALFMADEGRNTDEDDESELDDALRRAREAALLAAREAAEIEKSLNKMP